MYHTWGGNGNTVVTQLLADSEDGQFEWGLEQRAVLQVEDGFPHHLAEPVGCSWAYLG